MNVKYDRIVLKLSGEMMAGQKGFGIDFAYLGVICDEIASVVNAGVGVGIVNGGGNYWRGRQNTGIEMTKSDDIGMLATAMNSLVLCEFLRQHGVKAVVLSAVPLPKFAEYYSRDKAVDYLEDGKVVIYACGTGNPCFSTDSGAALRAVETGTKVMLKATNVDKVYDRDPKQPGAQPLDTVSYGRILSDGLGVIDLTAAAILQAGKIPSVIFNISDVHNITRAVCGEAVGTFVTV